MYGVQPT